MVPCRHFLSPMQVLEVAFLQPCFHDFVISFCHIAPGPFTSLQSFPSFPPGLLVIFSLPITASLQPSLPGQWAGWQGCPESSLRAGCWAVLCSFEIVLSLKSKNIVHMKGMYMDFKQNKTISENIAKAVTWACTYLHVKIWDRMWTFINYNLLK